MACSLRASASRRTRSVIEVATRLVVGGQFALNASRYDLHCGGSRFLPPIKATQKGPAGGGQAPSGVSGRRAPSAASVISASGIRIRSAWNGFLHRRSLEDSGRSDFTENGELESNLPRQHPLWLQRGDTGASSIAHEPMIPIDPDVGQEGRDLF